MVYRQVTASHTVVVQMDDRLHLL